MVKPLNGVGTMRKMTKKNEQKNKDELEFFTLLTALTQNKETLEGMMEPLKMCLKQERQNQRLLGGAIAFQEHSECIEIVTLQNEFEQKRNWEKQIEFYPSLTTKLTQYFGNYSYVKVGLEKDTISNPEQEWERAVKRYLNALEVCWQCQEKLKDELNKSIGKKEFKERHGQLQPLVAQLSDKISEFKIEIQSSSIKMVEKKLPNLSEGTKLNLQAAMTGLQSFYKKAYDEAYGIKGFWRWIKDLFQKSDRAKEINFLGAISAHENASDALRVQAISLVHNKILESEMFGEGSKLKHILERLSKAKVGGGEDEESLAEFLARHEDIYAKMPQRLKQYYLENKEDYSKRNEVSLLHFM
jgi:hypothetical protein